MSRPGPDQRVHWLHELYTIADPACTTRLTVPTLWDAKSRRVVNNEFLRNHSDIQHRVLRHRGADAGLLSGAAAPRDRCHEYAGAERREQRRQRLRLLDLAGSLRRFCQTFVRDAGRPGSGSRDGAICAARSTEADWRLFPSLVRFDPCYYVGYKCNLRRLTSIQAFELSSRALSNAGHRRSLRHRRYEARRVQQGGPGRWNGIIPPAPRSTIGGRTIATVSRAGWAPRRESTRVRE